jgi:hypothetical protein
MGDDDDIGVTHILRAPTGDYLGLKLEGWDPSSEYAAGDEWRWTTTAPTPASFTPGDDSETANLVRFLLKKWKSSHSVCSRIIPYSTGQLWGYPPRTWAEAHTAGVVWGDSEVAHWTGVA